MFSTSDSPLTDLVTARFAMPSLPATSVGSATGPDGATDTRTIERMLEHRTCRRFTDQLVDDELLDLLLATTFSTPSKSDLQQCSVIVVDDEKSRQAIADLIPSMPWVIESARFLAGWPMVSESSSPMIISTPFSMPPLMQRRTCRRSSGLRSPSGWAPVPSALSGTTLKRCRRSWNCPTMSSLSLGCVSAGQSDWSGCHLDSRRRSPFIEIATTIEMSTPWSPITTDGATMLDPRVTSGQWRKLPWSPVPNGASSPGSSDRSASASTRARGSVAPGSASSPSGVTYETGDSTA